VQEAPPVYPLIIKQLSTDEAKILASLNGRMFSYVYTQTYNAKTTLFSVDRVIEVDELPRTGLAFPDNIGFYFDHLHRPGLAGIFQAGNQEALFGEIPGLQTGIRVMSQYRLTDFGQRFVKACIGTAGPTAARSQDFLYGDDGMPI
jgi:hypothetical protein